MILGNYRQHSMSGVCEVHVPLNNHKKTGGLPYNTHPSILQLHVELCFLLRIYSDLLRSITICVWFPSFGHSGFRISKRPQKKIWKDMKYNIIHILFIYIYIYTSIYIYIHIYIYIYPIPNHKFHPIKGESLGSHQLWGKFFIGRPPANVAKQVTWTSHSPDRQISTWKLRPWNHPTKTGKNNLQISGTPNLGLRDGQNDVKQTWITPITYPTKGKSSYTWPSPL